MCDFGPQHDFSHVFGSRSITFRALFPFMASLALLIAHCVSGSAVEVSAGCFGLVGQENCGKIKNAMQSLSRHFTLLPPCI